MRSKLQTYEPTITPGRVARVAHARRYGEIIAVLIKYGFDDAVRAWHLAPPCAPAAARWRWPAGGSNPRPVAHDE